MTRNRNNLLHKKIDSIQQSENETAGNSKLQPRNLLSEAASHSGVSQAVLHSQLEADGFIALSFFTSTKSDSENKSTNSPTSSAFS